MRRIFLRDKQIRGNLYTQTIRFNMPVNEKFQLYSYSKKILPTNFHQKALETEEFQFISIRLNSSFSLAKKNFHDRKEMKKKSLNSYKLSHFVYRDILKR